MHFNTSSVAIRHFTVGDDGQTEMSFLDDPTDPIFLFGALAAWKQKQQSHSKSVNKLSVNSTAQHFQQRNRRRDVSSQLSPFALSKFSAIKSKQNKQTEKIKHVAAFFLEAM